MKIASNSKFAADTGLLALGAALLVLLLSAVATFFYVGTHATYDKEYINLAGEQRVLSQGIVKNAAEAASAAEMLDQIRTVLPATWAPELDEKVARHLAEHSVEE